MQRHKNILAAVDGSEAGFNALSESIRLARWNRGRVTALLTTPPYDGDLSLVGVKNPQGAILGPLKETLEKTLDLAEASGTHVWTVCEQGELHERLAATAASRNVDLIVLGVSGKYSFLKALMGDTVSGLLQASGKDVLTLPERATLGWEKMLFLVADDDSGDDACGRAIEVAASYGGSMKILPLGSCGESPNEASTGMGGRLSEIQAMAARAGVASEPVLKRGSALKAIERALQEHDPDIIVTALRGKTGLAGFCSGSIIERIVYGFSRPVLVLGRG
ncbi:MAG: universal stress protein [Acidobacteriota bacterium]